jgi:Ser/Thr protein kinase RdoA (MazF antagonist)
MPKGKYILKEYQSSYKMEDILKEEKITLLLKENGIPTVDMIFCLNGDYAWEANGRVFVLQKFMEGVVMDSHSGSKENMNESAKYLAKINKILQNINIKKEDNISNWILKEEF